MGRPAPKTVAFAFGGPIAPSDLPRLYERVCTTLGRSGPDVVLCDVSGVEPNAVTIDALARLELAARRHGCHVRLCHASEELCRLVEFVGLRRVLGRTDEFSGRPWSQQVSQLPKGAGDASC